MSPPACRAGMDDETRWAQVVARDPAADGKFIYAVKTTKIFCRPVCKARLARRSNVEFFNTSQQAQSAGYRPCKRCQPLLVSYTPEADKIKKACNLLKSLPEHAPLPGLERLAKEAGLTKHHFHRLFKRETGFTPREYALARRRRGDSRSETTESTIMTPKTPFLLSEMRMPAIADGGGEDMFGYVNFDDPPQLFDDIKLPSSQEARDLIVHYDIVETTYGLLFAAFQDRRVCKMELGTSERELMDRLEEEFPSLYYLHSPVALAKAEDAVEFRRLTNEMVARLEGPGARIPDTPPLVFFEAV